MEFHICYDLLELIAIDTHNYYHDIKNFSSIFNKLQRKSKLLRIRCKLTTFINKYNTWRYTLDTKIHRDNDLPAFGNSYIKLWFQHGRVHRDNDLPAEIYRNGDKGWFQHDKYHRDNDRPAIIHHNCDKYWYQHGLMHRDNDLPAIMLINGAKYWYQHDNLHRNNNLPAIIHSNGDKYWYNHGICVVEERKT